MSFDLERIRKHVDRPPLAVAPTLTELAARYRGQHVAIVGSGPSARRDLADLGMPIWAVGTAWIQHRTADLCFMMDDLEGPAWDLVPSLGQHFERKDTTRAEWEPVLQSCPVPVITAQAYPEKFPQTVTYPLAEVLARFDMMGAPYFAESVCYAIAWATLIGVRGISFIGCDYNGLRPAERAGCEYWIGRAREAGLEIDVANGSSLLQTGPLDHLNRHIPGLYGYTGLWEFEDLPGSKLADLPAIAGHDDGGGALGTLAMEALLAETGIKTVLDVGCGAGEHARHMADAGKHVTGVDPAAKDEWYEPFNHGRALITARDYRETDFHEAFDAVWSCHVLEHVDDPQAMLRKMFSDLRPGGLLAITVPPAQHAVAGGHFTLWNAGLLLYHLVRAGFDCRHARVKQYGYNLSVLVRKVSVPADAIPTDANYPIETLKDYLPEGLAWEAGTFNGDIRNLNW